MADESVFGISYNGFHVKKPLDHGLISGEIEYPFDFAYKILCLDSMMACLTSYGIRFVAHRNEWKRIKADIDAFYAVYSDEEIDAYNNGLADDFIDLHRGREQG